MTGLPGPGVASHGRIPLSASRLMSSNGKSNCRPEPYRNGKSTPPQPGDERDGEWPRERLVAMDRRFVERNPARDSPRA